MKIRNILFAATLFVGGVASAQTFNVKVGSVTYGFPAADAGVMNFGQGNTLSILGRGFALDDATSMSVEDGSVEKNVL